MTEDVSSTPAAAPAATAASDPEPLFCANHPDTETLLRCNRCGKPICLKCATLTDVGYRCKECIRGVQASYYNAQPADNPIAFAIAAVAAALAAPLVGLILGMVGFFGLIIAFMVGGAAGGVLAQLIRTAVSRRRGRYLRYYAIAGVVTGVLLWMVVGLILTGRLQLNITMLLFTVLAAATAYQILR
jgi:hypothetical protein